MNHIYKENKKGFKLALGFGFILYQPLKDQNNYYYVSQNSVFFGLAFTIDSKKVWKNL